MAVHFKLSNSADFESVDIDGHYVSVGEFKDKVIEAKNFERSADFDFQITNSESGEGYLNDSWLIPLNSIVTIKRIPVTQARPSATTNVQSRVEEAKPQTSAQMSTSLSNGSDDASDAAHLPGKDNGDFSLDQLMGVFNHQIAELQQLMLTRGSRNGEYTADLSALDVSVAALEQQLRDIKAHLKGDADTLLKAKAFIELSSQQQKRLQHIAANLPSQLPGCDVPSDCSANSYGAPLVAKENNGQSISNTAGVTPATKEKKGRGPPPRCYVASDEFDSLSRYMKGRLTLEKLNTAVSEMATFAEANAQLLATQRKKLPDDVVEKVLELREIAYEEAVKGKHFFLETDMRGQILKLDNTGKAILTVLRHLGRISEVRVGRQRVFLILKVGS